MALCFGFLKKSNPEAHNSKMTELCTCRKQENLHVGLFYLLFQDYQKSVVQSSTVYIWSIFSYFSSWYLISGPFSAVVRKETMHNTELSHIGLLAEIVSIFGGSVGKEILKFK